MGLINASFCGSTPKIIPPLIVSPLWIIAWEEIKGENFKFGNSFWSLFISLITSFSSSSIFSNTGAKTKVKEFIIGELNVRLAYWRGDFTPESVRYTADQKLYDRMSDMKRERDEAIAKSNLHIKKVNELMERLQRDRARYLRAGRGLPRWV